MAIKTRADVYAPPIAGPYMDAGRHPSLLRPGTLSRVVGADGRYVGTIRPFPGCNRLTFGSATKFNMADAHADLSSLSTVTFFRAVTLHELHGTPNANQLRGFLVRATLTVATTPAVRLMFVYYNTGTSTWSYTLVNSGTAVSTSAAVDVTTYGPFMYVTVAGDASYPRVLWYNGSAWTDKLMGPQYTTLAAPASVSNPATGLLDAGTYGIAYRFFDSTRNMYSPMSAVHLETVDTGGDQIDMDISWPGGTPNDFSTIELFRTIHVEAAGSQFDGGVLYKEKTRTMKAGWTTGAYVAHDSQLTLGDTLTDEQLVQQVAYDPWEDVAGVPPSSGSIAYYQGAMFMGASPTSAPGGGGIQWSNLTKYQPEQFNAAHLYRGKLSDGIIERLVEAGEVLYGLTKGVIYRVRKLGTQLAINRLHVGRGASAGEAAHAVGDDILLMTPLGIGVLNGMSGDLQIYSQLDRIIYKEWAGELGGIYSAYDSYLGASFFINTASNGSGEGIVIWHVSKTATMIKNCCLYATTAPHPVDGGMPRAFFCTSTGVVVYPDDVGTGTHTMMGITASKTLNGTATSGSATTLIDTGATFDQSMKNCYLYALNGGTWEPRLIQTVDVANKTLTIVTGTAIAAGTRYSISPVPFELVFPPVPAHTVETPVLERKTLTGVTIYANKQTGITDNVNAKWQVGAYAEGATTLADSNEVAMASGEPVSASPSDAAPGSLSGLQLEPYVGCYAAGIDFELTSVEFRRTMGVGRSL